MFTWLSANIGTILVGIILLLIIFFVIRSMRKDKKTGKGGCGCGCKGCASSDICHSHRQ